MKKILCLVIGICLVIGAWLLVIWMQGCGQQASTTGGGGGGTTTNLIRLYYTYPTDPSSKDKDKEYTSQNFGSAYSSDGINFTVEAGARLGPLANLTDPDVFKDSKGTWTMFYSKAVSPVTSEAAKLFKATCATASGAFADDSNFVDNYGNISSTLNVGGTYYVYAVSSEGIAISSYDVNANKLSYVGIVISSGGGADPSVIQLSSSSFKMYYKSSGDTYVATSIDGKNWSGSTLLISKAEVPGAVYTNNKIYLYYIDGRSTLESETSGKTLVKISSDNGAIFGSAQLVTGLHEAACDPDPVVYE